MQKLRYIMPGVLWIGLLAIPLGADGATGDGALIRVNVSEINETRSSGPFDSQCRLDLAFTGDAVFDALSVRSIKIDQAVDELDRDLTPRKTAEAPSGSMSISRFGGALKGQLTLRAPSRRANTIKLVRGEVELFTPTEANGGRIVIPNILAHPAEAVENAGLKQSGVQIMYLTKESYAAKRQEAIEEAKKSAEGNGALGKLGAGFADFFGDMFGHMVGDLDAKNSVALYIVDPGHRMLDVELQDATGKPLRTMGTFSNSSLRQIRLAAPAPADAQLQVYLATEGAVRSYPFQIENVPLP